jgi:site-specific DNA-adenine methylase
MKNGIQTNNFNISKPKTFTPQRIFDFVIVRLAEQGKASTTGSDRDGSLKCAYRGKSNTKCAIGHLIPDKLYSKLLKSGVDIDEGDYTDVDALVKRKEFSYLKPFKHLLKRLQYAHDSASTAISLREHLKEIAKEHKLKSSLVGSIRSWKPA